MIDLQKHLNEAQYKAVTTIEGPLLVIAGAGSGKTRVIEYRVLHLIQEKVVPSSILLLTFTRRAARQMLARASQHDVRCHMVDGGTFHSFAYKLLKRYAGILGFNALSILDEGDAQTAMGVCVKRQVAAKEKGFPKKETVKNIISMSVNKEQSIEDVLIKEYYHLAEYAQEIEQIKCDYTSFKREKGYMDFDDLLVFLRQLLQSREELRQELGNRYRYVMVDEYQDTNKLQGDITYLLAQDHENVMAVGDDAQSIYGFRGASHENIMLFPKKFKGCKVIKLEENYRSVQPILDLANAVLNTMSHKFGKHLVAATKNRGYKPQLMIFNDAFEEAECIVRKIKVLREEGVLYGQQAVLFRSAYISIPLQTELSRQGIPYQVYGGIKFYEAAHVKDVVSYLKVLHNPKDELAWMRLLQLLEGVGEKTSLKLIKDILGFDTLETMVERGLRQASCSKKCAPLLNKVGELLESIRSENLSIDQQFRLVLEYYEPILREKFDDWDDRLKDLEILCDISKRYEQLSDFLADFAIEPPDRSSSVEAAMSAEEERPLVLSTIHSAKGLEWECVFLIGLMEGILPVSFALNDDDAIEEEHRLFYVGITRAKQQLFLSLYLDTSHMGSWDRASRFIEEPTVLSTLEKKWSPLLASRVEY